MAHFWLRGQKLEAGPVPAGLHVVSTPIGHLGDITIRALDVLASAHLVLAEDTRVTRGLLTHFGIETPLSAYHEHNAAEAEARLLVRLRAGETIALVSDAGTPLVSDPGRRLVNAAIAEGLPVTAAPGASAVLTALVLAGLPADHFYFEGFLPSRAGERRRRIREISGLATTLILFEAPHRLQETLADLAQILGNRGAAIGRELTKKFETLVRADLPSLSDRFAKEGPPRGEIVIVIAPPDATLAQGAENLESRLTDLLKAYSARDASDILAAESGIKRREAYAMALKLATKGSPEA